MAMILTALFFAATIFILSWIIAAVLGKTDLIRRKKRGDVIIFSGKLSNSDNSIKKAVDHLRLTNSYARKFDKL